jgi:hypothetical protein
MPVPRYKPMPLPPAPRCPRDCPWFDPGEDGSEDGDDYAGDSF